VRLVNSVDPRHGFLRRSCLVTAADIVASNVRDGVTAGAVYEWARSFRKCDDDWGVEETPVLWFATFSTADSPATTFRRAANALGVVGRLANVDLMVARSTSVAPGSAFHVNASGSVLAGVPSGTHATVGTLGNLKPVIIERIGLGLGAMAYAELDLAALGHHAPPARPDRPIRSNHRMRRNLSFTCPARLDSSAILAAARSAAEPGVTTQVGFDSAYTNDAGERSVTIRVDLDRRHWQARQKASDYVERLGEAIVRALPGVVLRTN
jgi:phenylalanyl-tRNA synthetase beta subunit